MWSTGISWTTSGYEVLCVDEAGETRASRKFRGGEADSIARFLEEIAGSNTIAVIDSTNGLVDGPLCDFGIQLFRADPWNLAGRSRSALDLAMLGIQRAGELAKIDKEAGLLTGRFQELFDTTRGSTEAQRDLTRRGYFLERNTTGYRQIALTFDDGPSEDYTTQILDILRDYGVKATFFAVGLHASVYPKVLERAKDEGHGIGNHTWSHPFMPDLTPDELCFQIDSTNDLLAAITGERPTLLRPPYGSRTTDTLRHTADQGMVTVLWDRDSMDWGQVNTSEIIANSTAGITQGAIILMHDGGGDRVQTVAALPALIETLIEDHHELVAIDGFQ